MSTSTRPSSRLGDVFVGVDQNQLSQEFQLDLRQRTADRRRRPLLSARRTSSRTRRPMPTIWSGRCSATRPSCAPSTTICETTSYAAYANVSYAVTDRAAASRPASATPSEEKDYFRTTSTFSTLPAAARNPAVRVRASTRPGTTSRRWLSIDYQARPTTSWSTPASRSGFKSGGFNGRANNVGEQAPVRAGDGDVLRSRPAGSTIAGQLRSTSPASTTTIEDFQARVSGTGDRSGHRPARADARGASTPASSRSRASNSS